jgi:hypothetical protein
MVSWLTFGSEIQPQTSYPPLLTLLLLAASVFAMSSATIHSTISQPRPMLKPYHQLVHGLNSLLVWFQCQVWSADGAVCDNITPCPIGSKKVGLGGAIFTSSRHLLALPWQKSITPVHRLGLVSRRVGRRHHIGRCLCSSGKDVSVMHQ